MFRGFNLLTNASFEEHVAEGFLLNFYNTAKSKKGLQKYISANGLLDGTAMANDWFPEIEADIFISHSHNDESQAIGLAGWLYSEFGLTSFIDSCVWKQVNDLLFTIDKKYSLRHSDAGSYFDYQTRNQTTAFIHLMLTTALNKMIDRTECLIFLNTPNSITTAEAVSDKTKSPWIYSEIETSRIIRKRPHRRANEVKVRDIIKSELISEGLEGTFDVELGHLTKLYQSDLDAWALVYKRNALMKNEVHALDLLYIKNPAELNDI